MKFMKQVSIILCLLLTGCFFIINLKISIKQTLLNTESHVEIQEQSRIYDRVYQSLNNELGHIVKEYDISDVVIESLIPLQDIKNTIELQTSEIISLLMNENKQMTRINSKPYINELKQRLNETTYHGVFIRKDMTPIEQQTLLDEIEQLIVSNVTLIDESIDSHKSSLEFIYYLNSSLFLFLLVFLILLIFICLFIIWINNLSQVIYIFAFACLGSGLSQFIFYGLNHHHHYQQRYQTLAETIKEMRTILIHDGLHQLMLLGSIWTTFAILIFCGLIVYRTVREKS